MVRYTLSISEKPPFDTVPSKPYERGFSFLQRLFKVLFTPMEGMEDVALAPSYGEVFMILVVMMFAALVLIALVFSKIQFVGLSLPSAFWGIIVFAIAIALFLPMDCSLLFG